MKTFRHLFAVLLLWCGIATMNVYATDDVNDIDMTSFVSVDAAAYGGGECSTDFAPTVTTSDGRTAPMVEKYEETADNVGTKLSQEITNLGNGAYTVVLYANALYTSGRGFDSDLTDGATDVAYVFANGVQAPVTAHIGTSVDTNGEYTIEAVEVTDGTLELGIATAKAGTNWHTLQIKSLTHHMTAEEILQEAKNELKALIEEAATLSVSEEAIAKAQEVYENSTDHEAVVAATNELMNAILASTPKGWYLKDNHLTIISDAAWEGDCQWESSKKNIKTIDIMDGVTYIEEDAFYTHIALESITIPNSVTTIGASAFYCCISLPSVAIPNSVTSIGAKAFCACDSLKHLNFEDGSSTLFLGNHENYPTYPFSSTNLETLYIGRNLEYRSVPYFHYYSPFANKTSLKQVTISKSVTDIRPNLFYKCSGIEHIEFPNTIRTISGETFYGCNLKNITIPHSVTYIGAGAFAANPNLESITVESGNTTYNSNDNCNAIIRTADNSLIHGFNSTTIPDNVTSIASMAFYDCSGLTSITIPCKMERIESGAFKGCINLKEVTSNATIAPTLGDDVFDQNTHMVLNIPEGANYVFWAKYFSVPDCDYYENGNTIWYVDGQGNAYAYHDGGYYTDLRGYYGEKEIKHAYIKEGFTSLEYISEHLESVAIPSTITEIASDAFRDCRKLKHIHLHEGITKIGDMAFANSGIEFLVIPTTVEQIGGWAFGNESTTVVFKTFTPPIIDDYIGGNVYIPESANSYPTDKFGQTTFFYPRKEYACEGKKMFVFGSIEDVSWEDAISSYYDSSKDEWINITLEDMEEITFTPNPQHYAIIQKMPKLKSVNVQDKADLKVGEYYSISGSNAIFYYNPPYVNNGQIVLVAGCSATVIPEGTEIISSGAFDECTGLKEIEIPSSVKSVSGFTGCTGLTSITIPSTVEELEGFNNCTGLKSAVVHARKIRRGAFDGCTSLTDLTIGQTVNKIEAVKGNQWYGVSNAFKGCTALEKITVEEGNTVYDSRGGSNVIVETATNKLILASNSTQVPSDITAIAPYAFSTCVDLDVNIPSSVTSIDEKAFEGTRRVFFESEEPATITGDIFGWGAIYVPSAAYDTYCTADVWSDYKNKIVTTELAHREVEVMSTEGMSGILNAVGLDNADRVVKLKVKGEINSYDITVIRDKMPLLNEVDLSEATVVPSSKPFYQTYCTGKNSLGGYAFYDLDKLLSVKLPKGLEILGDYAFYGCDKLESVDASVAATLNIGRNAFENCIKLTEFVSPEQISEVGNYAFRECSKLENIELNDILGSIGEEAFGFCRGLKTIAVGSIGGNIQSKAFEMCSSLEDFKVNALSGSLNDMAFSYCEALKSVEFGKGPARIGSRVFAYSADNLERFVAGEGVKEVATQAFQAVNYVRKPSPFGGFSWEEVVVPRPNLKSVVLPQGLQSIGKEAFYQCTSLNDFTMPQSVTSIGESAFYECSSLESITIPNAITDILKNVFYGCNALKSVTFPDALTSIGESAFAECGFENLRLPPTVTTIGAYAFSGCLSLAELHIPSSMENIGNFAFLNCGLLNSVYTYTVEPTEITETTFSTFASATLYVPATSFWNYYWDIGWSRFNHKNFQEFNEPYEYFYLNNDYYLNGSTGYIEGTPDADLRPGSGLVVEGDESSEEPKQNLGDVNIGSDGEGNSASIIGDENLYIDNLNVKINVKGGRWYFFAFPWDVDLSKISMQNGNDYVFRHYDGEERAKNGKGGWKDVNESHLKAARGYIFQSSADDVLVISIEKVKFKKEDKYNELVTHASENLNDASWNLMGNPYLSYYDMAAMDYAAPVTVWDGEKYVAVRPGDDDYQFAPYEAFFVQKPEGKDNVGFRGDDQMTKTQAATAMAQKAKARRARGIDPQRLLINLVLGCDSVSDRTRVVFNDCQSHNYETACDAAKFESAGVPQLYTLDNEGVHYAINERPVGNGVVPIGYTAANSGYYTIEAARMETKGFLYDAENKITHNLEEGSYTFYSDKGTFDRRFSLGISSEETTGVENLDIEQGVETVEGGILFKGNAIANVYNASGMLVAVQNGAGMVQLPAGTYVVCVGENNTKVVVK